MGSFLFINAISSSEKIQSILRLLKFTLGHIYSSFFWFRGVFYSENGYIGLLLSSKSLDVIYCCYGDSGISVSKARYGAPL